MKLRPVITQVIDTTLHALLECEDFTGRVREELQPVITSVIRFLALCLDATEGGERSYTAYLFDSNAHENQLKEHLIAWFRGASGFTDLAIEAQQVGAGRIDVMLTFEHFRFVIELKREQGDATREGLGRYLRQAAAYQVTDIAVGCLVVLDLTAGPLPDHMRDHVWVDTMPSSRAGGIDRYVVVVRVPGNRTAPSRLARIP